MALLQYVAGGVAGFAAMVWLGGPDAAQLTGEGSWIALNLGSSTWLFAITLVFFFANMGQLRERLRQHQPVHDRIVFLDQLSDVWIHLFIGIGVVWTAIGMREALSATLAVPGDLAQDAGQVLGRLVDGGILLALTTTIVGALGGYAMRLLKTVHLGAALSNYYQRHARTDMVVMTDRLASIESLLAERRGTDDAA